MEIRSKHMEIIIMVLLAIGLLVIMLAVVNMSKGRIEKKDLESRREAGFGFLGITGVLFFGLKNVYKNFIKGRKGFALSLPISILFILVIFAVGAIIYAAITTDIFSIIPAMGSKIYSSLVNLLTGSLGGGGISTGGGWSGLIA